MSGVESVVRRLEPLTLADFLTLPLPPRGMVMRPWLPEKGLVMIYSRRGMAKTLFAMSSAYAIATGSPFLGFTVPKARRVLYLDGEMPAHVMKERFQSIAKAFNTNALDASNFRFLSADLTGRALPDLGTLEGQHELATLIADAEVIYVDNLSVLVRSGAESQSDGWSLVQNWALQQRHEGRSVAFVHHAGKSGTQRGTSRREDVLDTTLTFKRPPDYSPEQGARFEVHFEKARGIFGEDARAFEAQYEVRDGAAVWTRREIAHVAADDDDDASDERGPSFELASVAQLLSDGKSIREIAAELGMSKSTVGRMKERIATASGRLDS